jgi:hypothetical protein
VNLDGSRAEIQNNGLMGGPIFLIAAARVHISSDLGPSHPERIMDVPEHMNPRPDGCEPNLELLTTQVRAAIHLIEYPPGRSMGYQNLRV